MLTTSRPGTDEYAHALAGYVASIADDEDAVDVIAGHSRHHLEVVEGRYLG